MGPSGSGETTLLNMLGLLDDPTEGTVRLQGENVTDFSDKERTSARKETIGFVFQHFYPRADRFSTSSRLSPRRRTSPSSRSRTTT
jgi:predicted ABC-type transport system involved in lysophospholipase L1 biosynthesis ATPase subunit